MVTKHLKHICLPLLFLAFSAVSLLGQEAAAEKTAAGLYNDGLALLKQKNYEQGLAILEQALVKATADENEKVIGLAKKNGAMAAYNLGNTKRKAKAYAEADKLYSRGIELNPVYSSNYIGKARILDEQGKGSEAITAYMTAAQKASAEGKTSKVSEAQKRAKSVVSGKYKAKAFADVITLGQQFLAGAKNDAVSYYVAKSLIETGKHSDAIAHLDNAIAGAAGAKDKYYYTKATALEKLGKNADAVSAYKLITDEKYKKQADYKISTLK